MSAATLRAALAEAVPTTATDDRKEYARKLRRAAYLRVKQQRANDPKHLAFKEAIKQRQRAAYLRAKQQRANDPKHLAFKEAIKQRQRAAYQTAKKRRKVALDQQKRKRTTEQLEARTARDEQLMKLVTPATKPE